VPCVTEFAKRDRSRTIGLCAVGGPAFDQWIRKGLAIT